MWDTADAIEAVVAAFDDPAVLQLLERLQIPTAKLTAISNLQGPIRYAIIATGLGELYEAGVITALTDGAFGVVEVEAMPAP